MRRHNDTTTQRNTIETIKRLIAFTVILILVGCSSNPTVAGGSGTETTNGIVMLSSGKPAANAHVEILDRDKMLSGNDTAITTTTDQNGHFTVEHRIIDRIQIIVTTDSEAISLFEEDLVKPIGLKPFVSFSGTVTDQVNGSMMLAGIDTIVGVSKGKFRFEKIPAGWYPVLYTDGLEEYVCGSVNLTADLDTVVDVYMEGVLMANFTDGFDRNPLTELIGGTEWKTFTSKEQRIYRNGTWVFEQFNDKNDTIKIDPIIANGTLRVNTSTINKGGTYAGLRCKLNSADLSSMTTLKFRARGTGTVHITLETGVLNGTNDQYGFFIVLTDSWSEHNVPVSGFHLENQVQEAKNPWNAVSSKVQRIEFAFHGLTNPDNVTPLELEIDDIIFEGPYLGNL